MTVKVEWVVPTIPPSYHHPIGNTALKSLPYPQKPNHQRAYTSGGAIILTLGTCDKPTFAKPDTVNRIPRLQGIDDTDTRICCR
jgi:hypothetical protein